MVIECSYNELTGKKPTLNDCDMCREHFHLPHETCCLDNCCDCESTDCEHSWK